MKKSVKHPLAKLIFASVLMCLLASTLTFADRKAVTVIGYDFPPYVFADKHNGITFEFIDLLNKSQAEYSFTFRLTSANRRYKDFANPQNDIILFEMPEWGWTGKVNNFSASRQIAYGGEIYISQKKLGRGQEFFETLSDKNIAAIMGYHYGFANFNSDHDWLYQNFTIHLGSSHAANIRHVDNGRVDIAVVTKAFLYHFFDQNPGYKDRILVSKKIDQDYYLRALIRDGATINMAQFDKILDDITNSGELQKFQ